MPEELERELERALGNLPGPSAEAAERAQRAALDALPAAEQARRRWRAPALLAAALAAVLAAAVSVTLAATGTPPFAPAKHEVPAREPAPRAHVPGMLATYVAGRLWLGRTHGRRFSAVELSPGGVYLAVGEPGRLAVYTPDLRTLKWSHPVAGRVVAIAWRPIGTEIAYIVHTGRHNVLHLIQADGDTDQVVDTAVAPVQPSWRWDSQAFAYVGAGGRPAIRDLVHERSIPIGVPRECATGPVSSIAFAPVGRHGSWVAGALPDGNAFAADTSDGRATCFAGPAVVGILPPPLLAWTRHGELLAAEYQIIARLRIVSGHVIGDGYAVATRGVGALAPSPDGGGMLVALIGRRELVEVLAHLPPASGRQPLRVLGSVAALPVTPPDNYHAQLFWR